MSAEKVLAQIATLEQLLEARQRAWKLYQATLGDSEALIASPEYHAYAEASEAWQFATDEDTFKEPMLELKRAAAEWARRREEFRGGALDSRTKLEDFIALEDRLAELALVLLLEDA